MEDPVKNAICCVLLEYRKRRDRISAEDLVYEVNVILGRSEIPRVNARRLRELINELNEGGGLKGVILSSTKPGEAGYWLSNDPDEIRDEAERLKKHGVSEIKKARYYRKALKRLPAVQEELFI